MPLINCETCGHQISRDADRCIHCGHPNNTSMNPNDEQASYGFAIMAIAILLLLMCYKMC